MLNYLDKNGRQIHVDYQVLVPEPNETDIHHFEFTGFVEDILDNGNAIVCDNDGEFYEIECERLEVI
jgi:hypothetical protein